jgi:membrane protein DedA with SNARE-associated domain
MRSENKMNVIGRLSTLLWLGVLGYLGFYGYGLVMGVFSPGELIGFTVVAIALAAMYIVRAVRVQRAMRDHRHDALMRGVHRMRETRGF